MNPPVIAFTAPGSPAIPLTPVSISGGAFWGYALSPHVEAQIARSGAPMTRRTTLAEAMYRYRYQGDTALLPPLARLFSDACAALYPDVRFDGMLVVPPPISRNDYAPVIALITEISRITRVPSLQCAVRDTPGNGSAENATATRTFALSSPDAVAMFAKKRALVIDDLYRSGRSLNRFCALLMKEGTAAEVRVLVGTVMVSR